MKSLVVLTLLFISALFVACGEPSTTDEATTTEVETKQVADMATPTEDLTGLAIGDVAPDFELTGTDGATYSLATVRDANDETPKGYIVTFTCNTCPYAKGYENRLIELHERMSAQGYPVVAIQPNDVELKPGDSMEAMQKRATEKEYGFAYLLDAEQTVYPAYGASKTPEIFLLDADRVLQYHGAIDDSPQDPTGVTVNYVEQAIAALDAGEAVEPTEVKAIGCSIKAK